MEIINRTNGVAAEHCGWQCNLYNGCINCCSYCYNRFGPNPELLGNPIPTRKKGYDHQTLMDTFKKEFDNCKESIEGSTNSIFFSFVGDPMSDLILIDTVECINYIINNSNVICIILTKTTNWVDYFLSWSNKDSWRNRVQFGFTITNMDYYETKCPNNNQDRINAVKKLYSNGFFTWVSLEPLFNLETAKNIDSEVGKYCMYYTINTLSPKYRYQKDGLNKIRYKRKELEDIKNYFLFRKKVYWMRDIRELFQKNGISEPVKFLGM